MFASNAVELVGNHPKFVKAMEFARNIAVTKAPVLISGEAGTGKRAIAHYIHTNSVRKNGPFNVVDCALEPVEVENEVLGYRDDETGKFHRGILERSNGGTVIFANIDAIDEKFQKRLFTILQELPDYEIDVRVMATTTKNLSKYVGAGRFHRALYTYFSSSQINMIPLRERGSDIEVIADYYLTAIGSLNGSNFLMNDEAKNKIATYYWTHNITELKSVLENASKNAKAGLIDLNAIEMGERKAETQVLESDEDGFKLMSLRDAEMLLIKKALIHTSENRTQAAKILGVSIRTLRNKINEYRQDGNNFFVNLR
jgi:two-component system response regulator FlrC